jgi:hypothetical protein
MKQSQMHIANGLSVTQSQAILNTMTPEEKAIRKFYKEILVNWFIDLEEYCNYACKQPIWRFITQSQRCAVQGKRVISDGAARIINEYSSFKEFYKNASNSELDSIADRAWVENRPKPWETERWSNYRHFVSLEMMSTIFIN